MAEIPVIAKHRTVGDHFEYHYKEPGKTSGYEWVTEDKVEKTCLQDYHATKMKVQWNMESSSKEKHSEKRSKRKEKSLNRKEKEGSNLGERIHCPSCDWSFVEAKNFCPNCGVKIEHRDVASENNSNNSSARKKNLKRNKGAPESNEQEKAVTKKKTLRAKDSSWSEEDFDCEIPEDRKNSYHLRSNGISIEANEKTDKAKKKKKGEGSK